MITALRAAGLPAVVGVIQGLEHLNGKRHSDMKRWGHRFFESEFPGQGKAIDASNSSLLTRTLSTTPTRRMHWRDTRSYLVADSAKLIPSEGRPDCACGTLHVRGYVRGRPLGVNQLVHIGGSGHFRMRQINSSTEPFPLKPNHHNNVKAKGLAPEVVDSEGQVLAVANADEQEDLSPEAVVDGLAGEQTWPTQQELAQAAANSGSEKADADMVLNEESLEVGEPLAVGEKRRPRGLSEYQAEWLAETSSVEGDSDDHESKSWALHNEQQNEEMEPSVDAAKRRLAEDEDTRFPDEVDTPFDRAARERFARYRALKSFRTSPWDPKESLPNDYARIYQVKGNRRRDACSLIHC